MRVHIEEIYGFYHGQDPRVFEPDEDSCTPKEIAAHKAACEAAHRGEWKPDGSGCHITKDAIICTSSLGIGIYSYVVDEDGEFVRDATYEDSLREGPWDEDVIITKELSHGKQSSIT